MEYSPNLVEAVFQEVHLPHVRARLRASWAVGPRRTLTAIHPPPANANSIPTTENGPEISGA
jgi:hypothetical protein